jgi:hypothetical protein
MEIKLHHKTLPKVILTIKASINRDDDGKPYEGGIVPQKIDIPSSSQIVGLIPHSKEKNGVSIKEFNIIVEDKEFNSNENFYIYFYKDKIEIPDGSLIYRSDLKF